MNQPEPKYDKRKPFIMLAPHNAVTPAHFGVPIRDPAAHSRISSEMQVVRGAVALAEGAIRPESLDVDSRYQMPGDGDSWHLVRMGDDSQIRGSARIMVHQDGVSFARLRLSKSAIARSRQWKWHVRFAVERDMALAKTQGLKLVEPGGWVLREQWRRGPDAVSIALSAFAWSQLMGGCLAYVTATVKHGSSSILKRLGATPLTFGEKQIPSYYDPEYGCEMELLKVFTDDLNPRFEPLMAPLRETLKHSPVVYGGKVRLQQAGLLA
jgi:hypothetical protein